MDRTWEGTKASRRKRYRLVCNPSFPITSSSLCLSRPHELAPHMGCQRTTAYMNSHPIWGDLVRIVDRRLHHLKGHPQATVTFLASPLFLPRPPTLCLSSTFPLHFGSSQITQCLKRHTPPFHPWSNTASLAMIGAHLHFLEEFNHFSRPVVPSFLSLT